MKKLLFFFILGFIFSVNIYAQSNFKEGYFIDSENNKVECLIDLKLHMGKYSKFSYKTSPKDSLLEMRLDKVNELHVYNTDAYFKRFTLSEDVFDRNYRLIERKGGSLLLKVILESEVSLYKIKNDADVFLISLDNQLYFLQYLSKKLRDQIKEYKTYQRQLYEILDCNVFTEERFKKLNYNKKDLIELVNEYAICKSISITNFNEERVKLKLDYKITMGGFLYPSFENAGTFRRVAGTTIYSYQSNFEVQSSYMFGFETELTFTNGIDKWRLFLAPNYQVINGSVESVSNLNPSDIYTANLNESILEIPIGIRRYFRINKNLEVFTNAAFAFNVAINNDFSVDDIGLGRENIIKERFSFFNQRSTFFGIGATYKERFSLGFNYYLIKRNKLNNYTEFIADNAVNFTLSYKLF